MALTLAQTAKLEIPRIKLYVILNIIRHSPLMEWLPFENVDSLKIIAIRWQTLPAVAFRGINGTYTASEGEFEQVYESLFGFGGEIKFDRVFSKVKNYVKDPERAFTDQKIKSMSFTFNDYFINGDPGVDPLGFSGLKYRVAAMPTRQSVYFAGSSSAPLDPTASAANGLTFFQRLDEMYKYCNGGDVKAWFSNEDVYLGLGRVSRYIQQGGGGMLSVTKDTLGREFAAYKGAPIIDTGFKKDQSTEIITNTEVAGDAGADSTSIYAVSTDDQEGITGIQLSEMEVYDPNNGGEMETAPAKQTRIDWWCGFSSLGSHGIVRGRNLAAPSSWT
jgi:hypothetical protein